MIEMGILSIKYQPDLLKQLKDICNSFNPSSIVCSRTIWMGHLAKTVSREQVIQAFEDFGQVKSVEVSYITLSGQLCALIFAMEYPPTISLRSVLRCHQVSLDVAVK